ncbi:hypothetical protein [Xanthomonas sp. D-109]|uniref:hypothetical protein n=1 Tax=Xanthomonas sp. D-109 TaxID=2821274 RepID=UPI001ADAA3CF|nr:hypothetical protein [Xanthomonas sp. D-109]MBO9881201.1 hypothetical protein [Xanthomonas sp. D-109]
MEDKLDRLLSDVARLKQALQTRKTPAERAFRLLEKMLAPLAMAVLAFYGNAAADKISAGQLALAKLSVEDKNREFARSLQSKYVELFYADITSDDPVRQGHALGLLRLMDPPLALQLAAFVASSPTAPPALRTQAEATGRQIRREPRAPLRPPSTAVAAPSAPARPR